MMVRTSSGASPRGAPPEKSERSILTESHSNWWSERIDEEPDPKPEQRSVWG